MEAFVGTWTVVKGSDTNEAAFMAAAGIPAEFQEKYKQREYKMQVAMEGDKFKLHIEVTNDPSLPKEDLVYKLGEEFTFVDIDKQENKALVKWDGSKFVERYTDIRGASYDVTREIKGDTMTVSMIVNGVSNSQTWKRG